VLRLLLTLDGEIIKKVEPHIGYIHRSIEKMCEKDSYQQIVHLTDRMDYLSCHINNEGVCMLVENGLEIEVSDRVKYIRTIIGELTRLSSHQLWWGVMGMDFCNIPGGLMFDIPSNFQQRVKDFIVHFRKKLPEYDELLSTNAIFLNRTKGIGHLSKEDAISYGVTGPTARASGFACDIRKIKPYGAYDKVTFTEALSDVGDCYTRYKVRIQEMCEGDIQVKTKAVIKLPPGEYYESVETARGELGIYCVSDNKKNPYRFKFRSPGFSNLSALDHMSRDVKIADLVASMSSVDIVVPDIDR
jgi:NADH-quinone oxidoreductase subunit D/NADH-quinone oxidoreductase subunit C/D